MLILNVLSMPHSSNHGRHDRARGGDVRGRAHNRSQSVHVHGYGRVRSRNHHVHGHDDVHVRARVRGCVHAHENVRDGHHARSRNQSVHVHYFLNQLIYLDYSFLDQSYFTSIKRLNNYLNVSFILQHRFLKINT